MLHSIESFFSISKLINVEDIIVLGIRLLGILDEIETDIINIAHNEDSDYFSIGKHQEQNLINYFILSKTQK